MNDLRRAVSAGLVHAMHEASMKDELKGILSRSKKELVDPAVAAIKTKVVKPVTDKITKSVIMPVVGASKVVARTVKGVKDAAVHGTRAVLPSKEDLKKTYLKPIQKKQESMQLAQDEVNKDRAKKHKKQLANEKRKKTKIRNELIKKYTPPKHVRITQSTTKRGEWEAAHHKKAEKYQYQQTFLDPKKMKDEVKNPKTPITTPTSKKRTAWTNPIKAILKRRKRNTKRNLEILQRNAFKPNYNFKNIKR